MAELCTFSLAARCPETGMLGVAVASRFLAVGALCPHVAAGVGAVATQALVNPLLGFDALELLRQGQSATAVLTRLIAADEGRELRQLAVVDAAGGAAAHTGSRCVEWAGHRTGAGYAAAGNMLTGPEVLEAMERAFLVAEKAPFPWRLVAALEAGQAAGGDKRGKQAAALLVADRQPYPYVYLRVDDHPEPILELKRLLELSDRTYAPYRELLPTRERPSGVTDPEAIARARAAASRSAP
ncbi:MAG: DUF1028 domain-containing protein [Bacillota bacterium]